MSELCNIYDGTHQTPNYKDSGIMFLSVENIKELSSNKYISYEDFKKNFKVYPEKNDILMTRIGDIGTTNIVKENSLKAYYVSLALLKCKSINPYYLNFAIKSDYVQKGVKLRSLLTAIPMKINKDQIGEVDINYPIDSEEQSNIGKLFDNLDNLITLHHRKYSKKLQTWEQRKLKDISSYRRGSFPQPYGKEEWYGGSQAMPFVQVADVNDDLKLNEETKQTISKLAQPMSVYIPKESVIVTLQGTIGKVAITQYNTYLDRTILYFDTYKIGNINKYFWALTIKNKFEEERKKAPGAVIKTITKEVLSEFNLNIPQQDEQEKIGMLFANIDNLITLHQHQ